MNNTKQKAKAYKNKPKRLKVSQNIESDIEPELDDDTVIAADSRTQKRKTGDLGEELACKYLVNKSFTIIERNYLKKYGEIDIIAHREGIYHFFEVKTVTQVTSNIEKQGSISEFKPEDNVNARKLKKLARVIEAYILDKKLYSKDWEVGVITVTLNMETRLAKINVFNNISL